MARLDSGGSGGGSSDPAEPNDGPTDTDSTSTETTTQDPNDGSGLESRGRTETTDTSDGGGSDPTEPTDSTSDEATGGQDDQLESRSGESASSPSDTEQTQQQPEPEPEPETEPDAGTGTAPDSGGSPPFRDRIQNTRGRVASGVQAVKERFGQTKTGSEPGDEEDVNASPEPPEPDFSEREQQAVDQFLENNPEYSREDIADAEVNDDGSFSVSFTESGRETYLEENFEETARTGEAPEAAGDLQSSDGQDATVVFDQGLEAGDGVVAERAREIEQDILQDNPGLDESDVRITSGEDNRLQAELTDSGVEALIDQQEQRMAEFEEAGAQQPDNAVDPTQRAQENFEEAGAIEADAALQRIDRVTEIGGDATTAPDRELQQAEQTERVRADVVDQLEKQGVDLDRVNVDVERTPDGFEADVSPDDDEEFGNIDWSFGLGGPEDEVEQFVDERLGEEGSEFVGETVSDPLRDVADSAGESRALSAGPAAVPTGIAGPALGRERTTADEVETYLNVTADAVEDAPRLPGAVLELTEVNKYLAEPVTRGDAQEAVQRTADVAVAGGALAFQEGERAVRNPNRALAEVGIGFATGRAGLAARRAATSGRLLDDLGGISRPELPNRESSFFLDDRAQADLTGLGRRSDADWGSSDTVGLADEEVVDDLQRQETKELARQGQEQAEFEVERRYGDVQQDSVPEFRDELRSDNPSADDIDTSAQRGGNPQVASGEDITFAENFDRTIRAKNVPGDDLRRLDTLADDLAEPSTAASSRRAQQFGAAAGSATGKSSGTVSDISVGEGTTDARQPATFDLDDSPSSSGSEDVFGGVGSVAISGTVEELDTAVEDTLDSDSPTAGPDTQPDTRTDTEARPGVTTGPNTGLGTGNDTAADTDTGLGTDQPQQTRQPPVPVQTPVSDTPQQGFPTKTPTPTENVGRTPVVLPGIPSGTGGGLRLPDGETDRDTELEELFAQSEADDEVFGTGVVQNVDEVFKFTGSDRR